MAERHVAFERHGDVGVVVVDSPPLNLWTPELQADLENALDEAESEQVRALVLRAEGRAVVNRALPDDRVAEETMKFATELAAGPTLAHAATKRLVRSYLEEGAGGADGRIREIASALFSTEDLQGAVESFLSDGPGKANFKGS